MATVTDLMNVFYELDTTNQEIGAGNILQALTAAQLGAIVDGALSAYAQTIVFGDPNNAVAANRLIYPGHGPR